MDEMIQKHLYDILNAVVEIEGFFEGRPRFLRSLMQI